MWFANWFKFYARINLSKNNFMTLWVWASVWKRVYSVRASSIFATLTKCKMNNFITMLNVNHFFPYDEGFYVYHLPIHDRKYSILFKVPFRFTVRRSQSILNVERCSPFLFNHKLHRIWRKFLEVARSSFTIRELVNIVKCQNVPENRERKS